MTNIQDIQQINASELFNNSQAKAGNKEIFLTVVEDPTSKTKFRYFLQNTLPRITGSFLDLNGWETTIKHSEELAQKQKNVLFADALEFAKKDATEQEVLQIPIHKVIRIKHLKFKLKSA